MSKAEELNTQLSHVNDDRQKADLLNALGDAERNSNTDKAFKLHTEALDLASSINYPEGKAKAYWGIGICKRLLSQYKDAFLNLDESLYIYETLNDVAGKARVYNSIGNIYSNLGDHLRNLEYLNKSLELCRQVNDAYHEALILANIGVAYQEIGDYPASLEYYIKSVQVYSDNKMEIHEYLLNNIGIVYQQLGDYRTALDYYFKSLDIAKKKNNKHEIGFTLLNIADVYGFMKEYSTALQYLTESLEALKEIGNKQGETNALSNIGSTYSGLENYEMALEFQFKVLALREEISDNSGKATTMITIGDIYTSLGENEKAYDFYNRSLALSESIGDKINETSSLLQMGTLLFKTGKPDDALSYLTKALNLAEKRNAKKEVYGIHKALYEGYKSMGNMTKALKHHEIFYSVEKDIFNTESDKKLKGLIVKHDIETSEKEKKIAFQEKEIYKLKNIELADANTKLENLNIEKNEFLGIVAHDLKNPLSGILSFSKRIKTNFDNLSRENIVNFANEMEKAAEKMFQLISKMLDISAIESGSRTLQFEIFNPVLVAERVIYDNRLHAEEKSISIEFNDNSGGMMIESDKIALRQILDNLVSNAVKFTPIGKSVYFQMNNHNESVRFEVRDEGPGFTEKDKIKLFTKFARLTAQPTGDENSTGLGLSIAKSLTEFIDGKLWSESTLGNGSSFILELPVKRKEAGV